MRKPVYAICEQQQVQIRLAHLRSLISTFVVRCLDSNISSFYIRNFKPLASLWSWACRFEFYPIANPEDRFSCDMATISVLSKYSKWGQSFKVIYSQKNIFQHIFFALEKKSFQRIPPGPMMSFPTLFYQNDLSDFTFIKKKKGDSCKIAILYQLPLNFLVCSFYAFDLETIWEKRSRKCHTISLIKIYPPYNVSFLD